MQDVVSRATVDRPDDSNQETQIEIFQHVVQKIQNSVKAMTRGDERNNRDPIIVNLKASSAIDKSFNMLTQDIKGD